MSKLNTGLLVLIAVLTVINTYMIFDNDDGGNLADKTVNANAVQASRTSAMAPNKAKSTPMSKKARAQKANAKPDLPATTMAFKEKSYNFGKILQDTKNKHTFTFTNSGKEPLVISKAKGSCGCTVPHYPKEPIPPGETGEIRVVYSPGKQKNKQNKSVTITANTQPSTTVLKISADVQTKS